MKIALCSSAALTLALLPAPTDAGQSAGLETITEQDLRAHASLLADPALEGRDSPSLGLDAAARFLERCLAQAGLEPLSTGASTHPLEEVESVYRMPFEREMPADDAQALRPASPTSPRAAARSFSRARITTRSTS